MARKYSRTRRTGRAPSRRKSTAVRRGGSGRTQTVRLVFQAAPSASPMVLPQGSQLVMPGAPRTRKARF